MGLIHFFTFQSTILLVHSALSLFKPDQFLSNFQQNFKSLNNITNTTSINLQQDINNTNLTIKPPYESFFIPETDDTSTPFVLTNKNVVPQSFSILMNFKSDGTSLVQIIGDKTFYWTDNGRCSHARVYDPSTRHCRDVFCTTGYTLTSEGCVKQLKMSEQVKKRGEIKVDLSLKHYLCFNEMDVNVKSCDHSLLINDTSVLVEDFRTKLSQITGVNPKRFNELQIKSRMLVNENFSQKYNTTSEQFELSLVISKNEEQLEVDTLYFWLVSLAMEEHGISVVGEHVVNLVKVVEELDSTVEKNEWCSNDGDVKKFYNSKESLKIFAEFDLNSPVKYYVYIKETNQLYQTDDFKLNIIYNPINDANVSEIVDLNAKFASKPFVYWDVIENRILNDRNAGKESLLVLKDVTDIVLGNEESVQADIILNACDHKPQILDSCHQQQTVRIDLCELTLMYDRSQCSKLSNECYSKNQYEYDPLAPDKFIRTCRFSKTHNTSYLIENDQKFYNSTSLIKSYPRDNFDLVDGWISVTAVLISIIFLFATIVTYLLFKEMRTIPGWLILNLALTLFFAQTLFLAGSLAKQTPLACFITSIAAHYAFLASFAWMHVLAFDFYRNFRKNSSHVLLMMIRAKDRIPYYALYAYIAPFIFTVLCLLLDILLNSSLGSFRPCYAAYLDGCIKQHVIELIDLTLNNSNATSFNITECSKSLSQKYSVSVLSRTCWINNGNANLVYFGLPIALVLIQNAFFFSMTVFNIRKAKLKLNKNKKSDSRRFGGGYIREMKFYVQIAVILGFTWTSGFFVTLVPSEQVILTRILVYTFIITNGSIGMFIFFSFIFKKDTIVLYSRLLVRCRKKLDKNTTETTSNGSTSGNEIFSR